MLTRVMRAATRQPSATWGTEVEDTHVDPQDREVVQALLGMGCSFEDSRRAAEAVRGGGRTPPQVKIARALDWIATPRFGDEAAHQDQGGLDVRTNLGLAIDRILERTFQLQTCILLARGGQEMSPVPESITVLDEYVQRFGSVVVQCEQIGRPTNAMTSVRLVGYPVTLTRWEPFKPVGRLHSPIGWPTWKSGTAEWNGARYSRSLGSLGDFNPPIEMMAAGSPSHKILNNLVARMHNMLDGFVDNEEEVRRHNVA